MDISAFNPKSAASKGANLRLVHPASGELLKDEKGTATITLMGREAPEVEEAVKEFKRQWLRDGEAVDNDKSLDKHEKDEKKEQLNADLTINALVAATVDVKGIEVDDKPVKVDPKSLNEFYRDQDWIAQQAIVFFMDRKSFFGSAQHS